MVISCSGFYVKHSYPYSLGEFKFENQTGTLTIPNVKLGHAGLLTCRVTTTDGYQHSVTELTVLRALHTPANTVSTNKVDEQTEPLRTTLETGSNIIFNHILGSSAVSVALCALVVVSVLVIGLMKRRQNRSSADVKEFSVRFTQGIQDESASTSPDNAVVNLLSTSTIYQELNLVSTDRNDEQDVNNCSQTEVTHSAVIAYADVHQDSLDARAIYAV